MTTFGLDPRIAATSHPIAEWPLSSLRLADDARWPWLLLVPRVDGARELIDLSADQQAALLEEINRCSRLLLGLFVPDKLNVGALGNVVPQLHVHVVARRRDDPNWPGPIWGHGTPQPYSASALAERLSALREALAHG